MTIASKIAVTISMNGLAMSVILVFTEKEDRVFSVRKGFTIISKLLASGKEKFY